MLTDGEPKTEDLKIIPWRGSFRADSWWRWFHRQVDYGVSKSLGRRDPEVYYPALDGDYGKAWLADPCGMILDHSIRAAKMQEDEAEKAWKQKRREEKAQLYQLEKDARSKRPTRSRW